MPAKYHSHFSYFIHRYHHLYIVRSLKVLSEILQRARGKYVRPNDFAEETHPHFPSFISREPKLLKAVQRYELLREINDSYINTCLIIELLKFYKVRRARYYLQKLK